MRASLHSNERNLYLPLSPASSFLNQMTNEQSPMLSEYRSFSVLFCFKFSDCFLCVYDVWCREKDAFHLYMGPGDQTQAVKLIVCTQVPYLLTILPTPCFFWGKVYILASFELTAISLVQTLKGWHVCRVFCSTSQLSTTQRLVINCKCSADNLDLLLISFIYALSCGSTFF